MGCRDAQVELDRLREQKQDNREHIDSFTDKWGACKICEGEIPYGHQEACYLYTQEKEIKRLKEEAGNMQLAAGRYQYMHEQAQQALNKIDDLFEYAYKEIEKEDLQRLVREALAKYTEAISTVAKRIGT